MALSSSVFIVIPTESPYGVVFGKNSHRPPKEVQELVYEANKEYSNNDSIKCTYISVPATEKSFPVILSKPSWMWGCEMGANDQGVVGGNIPIKTRVDNLKKSGLLGTDLLRLALERSITAEEAVTTIGDLLAEFGQGGSFISENEGDSYNNSFILADQRDVWLMETAGKVWVAKKLLQGGRAFSNQLTIGTDYDKNSADLENFARDTGFWNGEGKLSWSETFQKPIEGEDKQNEAEQSVLNKFVNGTENFGVKEMMNVLRNKESRICRPSSAAYPTAASQISVLPKTGPCCHWFTATPDPSLSVFKPFIFTPSVRVSKHTQITEGNSEHNLYRLHSKATASGDNKVISLLQDMESNCLKEVETFILDFELGQSLAETDDLLKDIVETEVKFY